MPDPYHDRRGRVTATGLTYEDLQRFPEDNLRRELIDGELIVTAAPATGTSAWWRSW